MPLAFVNLLGGIRAAVFAAIALVALAGWGIQSHRLGASQQAVKLVAAEAAARKQVNTALEKRAAADISAIRTELNEANDEAQSERDRLLADLRSGERRLRQRFTCPRSSGAAAGAEGSAGSAESGLSRADGDFLIRFAGEADDVVRQLTACQDVTATDRK